MTIIGIGLPQGGPVAATMLGAGNQIESELVATHVARRCHHLAAHVVRSPAGKTQAGIIRVTLPSAV